MPRSDTTRPRTAAAVHVIAPGAVYTIDTATKALDLAAGTLTRAIRRGELEARRRGGRYFIVGSWLLRWLQEGQAHHRWKGGAQNGRQEPAYGEGPAQDNGRRS